MSLAMITLLPGVTLSEGHRVRVLVFGDYSAAPEKVNVQQADGTYLGSARAEGAMSFVFANAGKAELSYISGYNTYPVARDALFEISPTFDLMARMSSLYLTLLPEEQDEPEQ